MENVFEVNVIFDKGSSTKPPEKRKRLSGAGRIVNLASQRGRQGLTCDEAEILLGLNHQNCSARFGELRKAGLLVKTRQKRPTRTGKKAAVYIHPKHV